MPIVGQTYGLTGRKRPTRRVDMINAQISQVPAIYREKREFELGEESLALDRELGERELALSERALKERKKQGQIATVLGAASLGADIYFGEKEKDILKESLTPSSSFTTDVAKETAGTGIWASEPVQNIKGALNPTNIGGGALAGFTAGTVIDTTKDWQKALLGGVAGATLSHFTGDSLYDTAVGGVSGIVGSLFS